MNLNLPQESASYFKYDLRKPDVIFKYEIRDALNLLYLRDEKDDYVLANIQFFKARLNPITKQLEYYDKYTVRKNGLIQTYNYTRTINLINKEGPHPPFTPGWYPLKTASSGDGDKSLAAKMCYLHNMQDPNVKINGWIIKTIIHLMACNYDKIQPVGVYLSHGTRQEHVSLTDDEGQLGKAEQDKIRQAKREQKKLNDELLGELVKKLEAERIGRSDKEIFGNKFYYIPIADFERFKQRTRELIPIIVAESKQAELQAEMEKYMKKMSEELGEKYESQDEYLAKTSTITGGGKNNHMDYYAKYVEYKAKYLKLHSNLKF